ncbi:hypothetical protein CP533_2932 [Ophiocordyceps camponoti-saundersi (nom. inval.)]|nr:hypothetical protein CP533_2932 [Ophiocordyceps camponoti-saundersi (nom. inval.)]
MEQPVVNSELLDALRELQKGQSQLLSAFKSIADKLGSDSTVPSSQAAPLESAISSETQGKTSTEMSYITGSDPSSQAVYKSAFSSRIILTTYPKQIGIDPIPLDWGNPNPEKRGPVVVSRSPSTIRRRNAADPTQFTTLSLLLVKNWTLTIAVQLGPFNQWGQREKIVAMDPWGHLVPWTFQGIMERENIDLRPTVAITRAHMRLAELEDSVKTGRLVPDGKVCLNELGELSVTKFAVEPVWYLPGVAERFGIGGPLDNIVESLLKHRRRSNSPSIFIRKHRRQLSRGTLITRGDIKVFLPPIGTATFQTSACRRHRETDCSGGLTVYCFGDPAKMSDESVRLTLRIHDECNGSDVFGSDICTCRPYLIFGIEEAVKEAQNGGSGVVIYFRKEGRALGEVTKRGADRASDYFTRTENIAGMKDMRFQALMPDILHWLGINKIDRMLSMSKYESHHLGLMQTTDLGIDSMKYDAIVRQGIPIHERVELPEELIPADSRVEIDAKITAGYFTAGKRLTAEELKSVQGRIWDESVITLHMLHHRASVYKLTRRSIHH